MKHDEMEPFVEPKNEEPKNEEQIKAEEKKDEPIKENDRVKSEFKKSDGTKAWYQGTVQKVNPKTYWVLWDDGKRYLMKKNEVFKRRGEFFCFPPLVQNVNYMELLCIRSDILVY